MLVNVSHERIFFLGVFAFFVLATVSGAITTFSAQVIVVYVRVLVGAVLFFSIVFALLKFGSRRSQIYAMYLYLFLLAYGALRSVMSGASVVGFTNLERDVLVGLMGVLVVAGYSAGGYVDSRLIRGYLLYVLCVLCVTVMLGGLSLTFPPAFRFEYIASSLGSNETNAYSLGLSNFFGFAAVASALWARTAREGLGKWSGIGLALFCVFLSMLGGGRGESLAALILVLFLISRGAFSGVILMATVLFVVVSTLDLLAAFEADFLFVRRFLILAEGNLSTRDLLLKQGYQLLVGNSECLFFGCGFGFFQSHFQYDFSLYPHNFIVEGVIIYGAPLMFFMVSLVVFGAILHRRISGRIDLILVFFAYALFVALKSGYFLGAWMLVSISCYFAAVALDFLFRKNFSFGVLDAR